MKEIKLSPEKFKALIEEAYLDGAVFNAVQQFENKESLKEYAEESSKEMLKRFEGEKITENDVNMLCYFWKHKGDITRWSSWEERKHLFPQVVEAMEKIDYWHDELVSRIENIDWE